MVRESLRGRRVFRNYPTAVAARASVSKAVRSRLNRNKSIRLGLWADVSNLLGDLFGADYFVFPMGAVPKPHAPTVMRHTSDHTRTGLNMATVLGILGNSLDAYKQLEHLLSAGAAHVTRYMPGTSHGHTHLLRSGIKPHGSACRRFSPYALLGSLRYGVLQREVFAR